MRYRQIKDNMNYLYTYTIPSPSSPQFSGFIQETWMHCNMRSTSFFPSGLWIATDTCPWILQHWCYTVYNSVQGIWEPCKIPSGDLQSSPVLSPSSCRYQSAGLLAPRVLWILLVRTCTVWWVFVSVWTFPLARIFFIFRRLCWAQLCPRLTQHRLGFTRLAFTSMAVYVVWFFVLVLLLLLLSLSLLTIGLLRLSYPRLDSVLFAPYTFYTQNLSKCGRSQNLSQWLWPFPNTLLYTYAVVPI